ncbi:MAG: hypothetical protein ACRD4K_12725, partial [Candidatus Acidiferrales bacterium]
FQLRQLLDPYRAGRHTVPARSTLPPVWKAERERKYRDRIWLLWESIPMATCRFWQFLREIATALFLVHQWVAPLARLEAFQEDRTMADQAGQAQGAMEARELEKAGAAEEEAEQEEADF